MDKMGKRYILIFLGIFLLVSSVIAADTVIAGVNRCLGDYGFNRVLLQLKDNMAFDFDEVVKLQKRLSKSFVTYSIDKAAIASADSKEAAVTVSGVNWCYNSFKGLRLLKGSFWSSSADSEGAAVAVLDKEAAEAVFGSTEVIGLCVEVFDRKFQVVGIVEDKNSLMDWQKEDKTIHLYVPGSILLDLNRDLKLKELQIGSTDSKAIDKRRVETALRGIGKDPGRFAMLEMHDYYRTLLSKAKLPLFIIGIMTIFLLVRFLGGLIRGYTRVIRDNTAFDWIRHAGELAAIMIFTAAIVMIWLQIRFVPYIPASAIPQDLIDWSFYYDRLRAVFTMVLTNNAVYDFSEQTFIATINNMESALLFISLPLGLLLLHIGLSGPHDSRTDVFTAIGMTTASLILGLLVLLLLHGLFRMDIGFDAGKLAVLLGFIYTTLLYKYDEKERKTCLKGLFH